ncbi:MAG: 30S ribosomal protein S1 [Pseudomonadota bacterium]|jgi:small subunit ribosomal protein S1|nr:30S ribosomal protein S1 [Alphaproteobacteria bacterium]
MQAQKENFESLLNEFMQDSRTFEGKVVKGTIISIHNDMATIDIGMKSEGRVPLKEITGRAGMHEAKIGDRIEVYVERLEDRHGEAMLSVEKARREASWNVLEEALVSGAHIDGVIFGRVKGGFAVDLDGVVAFLPGSQVDIRPIRDLAPLMNIVQPFKILKMDKSRSNIVVSRRSVLEESRAEARTELVANLNEGQVVAGVVKNITDYGAFIDLGGVDGLLHVTDISWRRINHPNEVLKVGETINVQVIRYNKDTQRISLGMKQLENDPWQNIDLQYKPGQKVTGKVTNITDYGAFVELQPAIEGLIYVTEMSWTKKNIHPGKVLTVGQDVEVVVLAVDLSKRRISLGLKQCMDNPWQKLVEDHPVGSIFEGVIKNVTEFGLFVGINEQLDGMVHINDISWEETTEETLKQFTKGQMVKVKVLDIDPEKERVSLGVKQVTGDPLADVLASVKKGDVVTCSVTAIDDKGMDVALANGLNGYIKKADIARDRSDQRLDRFAVGEKIDAKVLQVEKSSRKVSLSIKAREMDEEKEALSTYGSSDSGATLGDILGTALSKAKSKKESEAAAPNAAKEPAKKAKKEETDAADAEEKPKKKAAPKKKAVDEADAE